MSVLVIGRYTPEQLEAIRMAIARADVSAMWAADAVTARAKTMEVTPSWLLIDSTTVDLESFTRWVRSEARLFGVMIVAVTPHPSDGTFAEAIATGCDDLIATGDHGAITRRAATLHKYDPSARAPASQGGAVIAHPDDAERRILGRVLRLAGFEVTFAHTAGELIERAAGDAKVIVVSDTLEGGALTTVEGIRAACNTPCVVVGGRQNERARALPQTAVVSEHAPADHLLFVVNELLSPNLSNLRSSRRLLWDAMCAFRPQGEHRPVFGLTYNLSYDGLYVRTLDPPTRGQRLWFELRPPHAAEAVHLRGDVVWVRKMSERPGGIVPPGFGVRIDETACPPQDLAQYRTAYEGLVAEWRQVA